MSTSRPNFTSGDPVLALQQNLTPRDRILLGWLADHGLLTTDQIAHALFPSLDFAQRRLRRLLTLGALDRFRAQKPDGGSYSYRYVLAYHGAGIIAAERRQPPPRRSQVLARNRHLASLAHEPHLLGINGFFTNLAGHARTHPHTSLDRWLPAAHFYDKGAFYAPGSNPQVMLGRTPRPDAHGIWTDHHRSIAFYLEHDQGTEPHHILLTKITDYLNLAAWTGRRWPILFWLPTAARELHLHHAITTAFTNTPVTLPIATAARDHTTTTNRGPADNIWWLHGTTGNRRHLTDLPPTTDHDYRHR
jgi:Replication-relaxation